MKKLLALLILLPAIISCTEKHDEVDDEYSRGFFNCLAIIQNRYDLHNVDSLRSLPYWDDCKKSYLSKADLYNYWDSSYMKNRPKDTSFYITDKGGIFYKLK